MKKILFIVVVTIFVTGLLVTQNTPAPAKDSSYLEDMRNITAPPDSKEFVPYSIKSVPENTDASLGELIDVDLEVYEDFEKPPNMVRVRALKPRDGVDCADYGMNDRLAVIGGEPTPLCVIIEQP